ncbi:MAG: 2-C-methyl-D-erythritol 4-phosphate cytidylyltransferase [Blastocatellia bacterium]|nr:2-C-methyl-D-erythritol 4-phosphate cytidylyltransferase [Blastocatellia bacterium]
MGYEHSHYRRRRKRKRFGSQTPKQFLKLGSKPLIIHTLECFQSCPSINQIILVLPAHQTTGFLQIISQYGITKLTKIVAGGATRAESVWKGFKVIQAIKAKIVAVHDGARPLVTPEEITACIEQAEETGAAILVAPVTDTIKEIKDGKIIQTIDRNKLRRALTPQCFKYEILKKAFANVENLSESATDESFLVEKLGVEVSVVEGSARNIKVTTKEDLRLVESLLKKENV